MGSRGAQVLALVLAVFFVAASTGEARQATQARIPLPSAGNVTVARLTITAGGGTQASPRLTLAGANRLPATAYVAATVGRVAPGRFQATVAVFNPVSPAAPTGPPAATGVTVVMPRGFALAGLPQVANDVLYTNPIPAFRLLSGGAGLILGGASPPKLPPAQIVRDAQQLAFERSVPLVDVGLLGLEYVAAQFSKAGSSTLEVTLGLYLRSQVNAIELRFPAGTKVSAVSGSTGSDALLLGSATQLVASNGFYEDGVLYRFTVHLSQPSKKGDFVTLRASAHYFESSLPFTERFVLA